MKVNESLYKFVDVEDDHNISNLRNNELLCKYFDDFNDPYEGHFGVTSKWPCPHKETERLRSLIAKFSPKNSEENTRSIDHMISFINSNNHINKFAHDALYTETKRYRVCSFTRRWNNILMWSHYSNGGRGAALVFDKKKLLDSNFYREIGQEKDLEGINLPIKGVHYKNSPPVINSVEFLEYIKDRAPLLREKMSNEIFVKCFLTKYKTWKYEQESRLTICLKQNVENRPILYRYPKGALTGVIIANKCNDESYVSVANSVDDDVKIYLACQEKSKYKYKITHEYFAEDIKSGKVVVNKELK